MASPLQDQLDRFRARGVRRVSTAGEGTWSYVDSGGDGPVHLLLHGGLGDAESCFRLYEPLCQTARVLAPSVPVSVRTIDAAVGGLAALLEAAGAPRVHVFGHSQGGYLAQAFARVHAETVASLVVSGSRLASGTRARALDRQLFLLGLLPEAFVRAAAVAQLRRVALIDLDPLPASEAAFWMRYLMDGLTAGGFKTRAEASGRLQCDYHRTARFGSRDVAPWPSPCAILSYGLDPLISPADVLEMTASHPEADHHRFPAQGHLGPFIRPEASLAIITALAWGRSDPNG